MGMYRGWGPQSIAAEFNCLKIVVELTLVYGGYNELDNYSFHGVYKSTYNWRAPSCRDLPIFEGEISGQLRFQVLPLKTSIVKPHV